MQTAQNEGIHLVFLTIERYFLKGTLVDQVVFFLRLKSP